MFWLVLCTESFGEILVFIVVACFVNYNIIFISLCHPKLILLGDFCKEKFDSGFNDNYILISYII